MEIGLHGMHHRSWPDLSRESLDEELIAARGALEESLGEALHVAACPFGSYNSRVLSRLRELGYTRVYTSDGGSADPEGWMQARNTVRAGDSGNSVRRICQPWSWPRQLRRSLKTAIKARR
jgi:peptidoglycan/xylan/chitin deacetylase (PgdA/CDA1 family)